MSTTQCRENLLIQDQDDHRLRHTVQLYTFLTQGGGWASCSLGMRPSWLCNCTTSCPPDCITLLSTIQLRKPLDSITVCTTLHLNFCTTSHPSILQLFHLFYARGGVDPLLTGEAEPSPNLAYKSIVMWGRCTKSKRSGTKRLKSVQNLQEVGWTRCFGVRASRSPKSLTSQL